ncbi:MAG: hypothetical protein L0H35_06150 [Psychrobacter sp.]|nr:hypothetical protein [Psychrobacter sp.]
MLGQMMHRPLLISHLIERAAKYHGDTPIISRETDGSTTHLDWKPIHSNSKRLANTLVKSQRLSPMVGSIQAILQPSTKTGI